MYLKYGISYIRSGVKWNLNNGELPRNYSSQCPQHNAAKVLREIGIHIC